MSHGGGGAIDIGAAFSGGGHGPGHGGGLGLGHSHGGYSAGHGMGHSHGDQGAVDGARRMRVRGLDSDDVSDTLMLSYDHGSAWRGGQAGYDLVDSVHGSLEWDLYKATGPQRPAHKRELTPEQIELVKRLADDPERIFFGVHIIHHGKVDLKAEFGKLAQAAGCHRVSGYMPNFFPEDASQSELADWNRWIPPYTRKRVPASYYPGATGFTEVWKEYWQVIRKPGLLDRLGMIADDPVPFPKPGMRFDVYVNTVLEVSAVTWYFSEMGDFETRFHIKVVTLPYLDPRDRQWGTLIKPFKQYQKAARTISEAVMRRMKEFPPEPITFEYRKRLFEELKAKYGTKVAETRALKDAAIAANTSPVDDEEPTEVNTPPAPDAGSGTPPAADTRPSSPPQPAPTPPPANCVPFGGSDLQKVLSQKDQPVTVTVVLPPRRRR